MEPTRDILKPLLSLLEQRVGLRLQSSATQALGAFDAMADQLKVDADQLLERLSSDPALLEALATQLTIAETHFFRIGPQIHALKETVLPDLGRRLSAAQSLRFWSAGCSTGEEAYTLAMLAVQMRSIRDKVVILGTDLHPESLETARRGRYGEWSFRDTPHQIRETYFTQIPLEHSSGSRREHSSKWQIADSLQKIVRFELLNLLNADWSQLELFDLILCRNVMIYFSNATAQDLIERMAAQLRPGGWLMLGPSDPPPLPATLERSRLTVRYEAGAILYQKQLTDRPQPPVTRTLVHTLELPPIEALFRLLEAPVPPQPQPLERDTPAVIADFEHELQLGMNALEAAQIPVALAALRRAVYLEPQSALAQFLLAQALVDSGQPDRARVALRQAQRFLPGSGSDLHRAVTALSVKLGGS